MASTGVVVDDFNQILADFTRALSYKTHTVTNDYLSGDERDVFATATTVNMIFFMNDNKFIFDKEGLTEVGDAYIMAPTTVGIKKFDQFTVDGITYYIDSIVRRYVLGTAFFDYATCYEVGSSGLWTAATGTPDSQPPGEA